MRKTKLINMSKLYLIPILITILITFFTSLLLYTRANNKYHDIYINNTMSYSKAYVDKIIDNKDMEDTIKENIFDNLTKVANIALLDEAIITSEYLNELAKKENVSNIVYFNISGEVISNSNLNFDSYQMTEGDPIYNFIKSGKTIYKEDIRKSLNYDVYNMYLYKMNETNDYFIQVSIDAKYVYELTEKHSYQKVLKDITETNDQVLEAFIISIDGKVTLKDVIFQKDDEFQYDYSDAFNGIAISRGRKSKHLNQKILEIVRPIELNNEIKEVVVIYYSLDFYNQINNEMLIIIFSLSLFIILVFSILVIYTIIRPLSSLEASLSSLDAVRGTYSKPKKNYGVFKEAFNAIDSLSEHIKVVNVENKKLNESIYELALTDYLTNLPNRMKLVDTINKYIRNSYRFALIFIDIDNFKTVNDTKGHVYGDRLLVEIVKRFTSLKNEKTFISRYGGDEFVFLLEFNMENEITLFLNDLYELFKKPIIVKEEMNFIDLSVGISKYPYDSVNSSELIRKADVAMYYGKSFNKNSFIYYNDKIDDYLEEELYIKERIEEALLKDGFKILLQPQINIYTNEIISYEALARFKDYNIGPNKFINVAEKYGLIHELGKSIIKKVVLVLDEFRSRNLKLKTIYANFSIYELKDEMLVDYILDLLNEYNIDVKYFGIEITEGVLIKDEISSINFFNKLKEHGFKVAIDDFGSGNASISYLIEYPLRLVKLDRTFVNKYLTKENINIFNIIVSLANELKYDVLAEGIETKEQINFLKQTECKFVQGYYYYKPTEVEEIIKLEEKKNE